MSGAARSTHVITDHPRLLALTGDDPYVRFGVPDPLPGRALRLGDAVAVERLGGRRHGFVVWLVGDRETGDLSAMLELLDTEGHLSSTGARSISLPQHRAGLLRAHYRVGPGGDWDWMWTTSPPSLDARLAPLEQRLVRLDDRADAAEIAEFTAAHNPVGEGAPGSGASEIWLALREPETGALQAVGAMQRLASGAPHLAGIVTATGHRGSGLGAAVTAGLTRLALDDSGVCTLGVYSDNAVGLRLYRRLGFQTAHAWHSRAVLPRQGSQDT